MSVCVSLVDVLCVSLISDHSCFLAVSRAGIELVEEGAGVDEDTRTPSSGRWDGILTSAACLWRPFGTQVSHVMLLA